MVDYCFIMTKKQSIKHNKIAIRNGLAYSCNVLEKCTPAILVPLILTENADEIDVF